ncbi:MAG: mono/diheme cytochrome c family protein [Planctomycetota bacterium]|jgi:mono/diheme cytochrome c family protein
MIIDVYLDDDRRPFQKLTPPEKFQLNTQFISDGSHQLRFVAIEDDGVASERTVRFTVQNGPSIAVHGIVNGDIIQGNISVLANAYSAKIGDDFEPLRIESPVPIPTWAWVLFLSVLAWGAGYVSQELHARGGIPLVVSTQTTERTAGKTTAAEPKDAGSDLGAQIYGNNCSSCHQVNGTGLPGVFPPLKGNPAVLNEDPSDHISTILNGLSNKVIDGVSYAAPMPPFGANLTDEEVAAVVNHERSNWGNNSPAIIVDDVKALRN